MGQLIAIPFLISKASMVPIILYSMLSGYRFHMGILVLILWAELFVDPILNNLTRALLASYGNFANKSVSIENSYSRNIGCAELQDVKELTSPSGKWHQRWENIISQSIIIRRGYEIFEGPLVRKA